MNHFQLPFNQYKTNSVSYYREHELDTNERKTYLAFSLEKNKIKIQKQNKNTQPTLLRLYTIVCSLEQLP